MSDDWLPARARGPIVFIVLIGLLVVVIIAATDAQWMIVALAIACITAITLRAAGVLQFGLTVKKDGLDLQYGNGEKVEDAAQRLAGDSPELQAEVEDLVRRTAAMAAIHGRRGLARVPELDWTAKPPKLRWVANPPEVTTGPLVLPSNSDQTEP